MGSPLRIAIVGLGPKGLFSLERLLDEAADPAPRRVIEIDIFEPHRSPGAGPVYDPQQPEYLRMNLGAESVGLWQYGNRCVPPEQQLSFVPWRRAKAAGPDSESYPPRAQVGRYLADSLATLLANQPDGVAVGVHAAPVERISRAGELWEVCAGASGGVYEEVLISCGHQDSWDGALAGSWDHAAPLIGGVFPVERNLTVERLPAGSSVAVRGFGLTFVDAALALTEGRGGRFEALAGASPAFRYIPCGDEPCSILPFTRTGLPMHAKTEAAVVDAIGDLDSIGRDGRARIERLPPGFEVESDLLPILADVASASLDAAGTDAAGSTRAEIERWLVGASAGVPEVSAAPLETLKRSLLISSGESKPDAEWALARSWLLLYPSLAPRVGGDALDARNWIAYRMLAREMERIAFGPPPVNAAKLVALEAAGLVDLRHLAAGVLREDPDGTSLASPEGGPARRIDLVIDAVLPEAGALGSHRPLVSELLNAGLARVQPGRRGIDVSDDGSCIGADGRPTPGIAAVGRPTEDSVIDNDTLSRERHPQPGLWAARIVAEARRPRARAAGVEVGR